MWTQLNLDIFSIVLLKSSKHENKNRVYKENFISEPKPMATACLTYHRDNIFMTAKKPHAKYENFASWWEKLFFGTLYAMRDIVKLPWLDHQGIRLSFINLTPSSVHESVCNATFHVFLYIYVTPQERQALHQCTKPVTYLISPKGLY